MLSVRHSNHRLDLHQRNRSPMARLRLSEHVLNIARRCFSGAPQAFVAQERLRKGSRFSRPLPEFKAAHAQLDALLSQLRQPRVAFHCDREEVRIERSEKYGRIEICIGQRLQFGEAPTEFRLYPDGTAEVLFYREAGLATYPAVKPGAARLPRFRVGDCSATRFVDLTLASILQIAEFASRDLQAHLAYGGAVETFQVDSRQANKGLIRGISLDCAGNHGVYIDNGDIRLTAIWFAEQKARAEAGDPAALFNLGYLHKVDHCCMLKGVAVPPPAEKDGDSLAFAYFNRAAKAGLAAAYAELGDALYYGRGVAADPAAARKAYLAGARAGSREALSRLKVMDERRA